MSLRELTALVLLYRACEDDALRRRVLELVPDLSTIVDEQAPFVGIQSRGRAWGGRDIDIVNEDDRQKCREANIDHDAMLGDGWTKRRDRDYGFLWVPPKCQ